jgi:hypothetical protein
MARLRGFLKLAKAAHILVATEATARASEIADELHAHVKVSARDIERAARIGVGWRQHRHEYRRSDRVAETVARHQVVRLVAVSEFAEAAHTGKAAQTALAATPIADELDARVKITTRRRVRAAVRATTHRSVSSKAVGQIVTIIATAVARAFSRSLVIVVVSAGEIARVLTALVIIATAWVRREVGRSRVLAVAADCVNATFAAIHTARVAHDRETLLSISG